MANRSSWVQAGKSAVLWDHHIIAEQFEGNAVLRLLQQNSHLVSNNGITVTVHLTLETTTR